MRNEFWLQSCENQDFLNFLQELIDYDMIEKATPSYGITRMVIDGRYNELSDTQWKVFVEYVAEPNYVDECARNGCDIPWCEMIAAIDNGGYCGWCAHMLEKLEDD